MKSLSEFFSNKLAKGIESKAALAAEGKTAEEIEQSLGEAFKLEGDKLKYFFNSMEIAGEDTATLIRVRVVSFGEGESIPPKAVKVDENYYISEFQKEAPQPITTKPTTGGPGGNKGKGKRKDGPKSSPWGISPEEMAAKKASTKENIKK